MAKFKNGNVVIGTGRKVTIGSLDMTENSFIETLSAAEEYIDTNDSITASSINSNLHFRLGNSREVALDSTAESGEILLVDASLDNLTVLLIPENNARVTIKKIDSSTNQVIISSITGLIEGLSTLTLENPYECASVVCDGTDWWVTASNISGASTFKFQVYYSAADNFTLPIAEGGAGYNHNFTVSWGDGTPDSTITSYDDADAVHSYTVPGTYDITMTGLCEYFNMRGGMGGSPSRSYVTKLLEFTGDMGFKVLSMSGCNNLDTIIPLGVKASLINVKFNSNPNITLIPADLFRYCPVLENCSNVFQNCTGLTSIPTDLFKYNTLVTDFSGVFWGCANPSLTSIPTDLFAGCPNVTNFYLAFAECSNITSLPADLFKYNTLATNFTATFTVCTSLTLLPADLFKYNIAATHFDGTFSETGLTSIPADLFKYNVLAWSFSSLFSNDTGINTAIPGNIFLYNTAALNLNAAFGNCSSMTGSDWQTIIDNTTLPGHLSPLTTEVCFFHCYSLTGYASIPSGWK